MHCQWGHIHMWPERTHFPPISRCTHQHRKCIFRTVGQRPVHHTYGLFHPPAQPIIAPSCTLPRAITPTWPKARHQTSRTIHCPVVCPRTQKNRCFSDMRICKTILPAHSVRAHRTTHSIAIGDCTPPLVRKCFLPQMPSRNVPRFPGTES